MRNPNVRNSKLSVLLLTLTKHSNDNKIQIIQPFFFFQELLISIPTVIKLVPKTIM